MLGCPYISTALIDKVTQQRRERANTMAAAAKTTKAAPAKAKAEAVAPEATEEAVFGVSDIADLIKVETGKVVKTRDLRILLRKLARDGRLDREIIAGNRARWEFDGPEDPRVEAVLEAYKSGELEADKQEKLQALKDRKAAQKAEKAAAAAAAAESDEDEVLEED